MRSLNSLPLWTGLAAFGVAVPILIHLWSRNQKFETPWAAMELLKKALIANDLSSFGQTLHEGWMHKRTLASGVTMPKIDNYYEKAIAAGATGGRAVVNTGSPVRVPTTLSPRAERMSLTT